jgi:succinoglycan biosynthesis protein ExoA
MTLQDKPFVTIVMPALNEEAFIASAIASIVPRGGALEYELLILDGASSDRTRDIVQSLAAENPRIKLIHNERRIQAAAVNLAARLADPRSRYLVRADCHSRYPERFVEICIDTLIDKQVASVVVPMRTEGTSCMQRAIAGAQTSRLGNGGSPQRTGGRSAFDEHGHHAAFDRQAFLELGGYDETFTHNEDAEFDVRLVRSGRRIFLQDAAAIHYSPRRTLRSLARQYRSYGAGTAKTARKHAIFPKLRRALPVAIFMACIVSIVLAPLWPALLMVPAAYLITCLAWGPALAWKWGDSCLSLSGVAAVVMHMSWAAGFLLQLLASRPPVAGDGSTAKAAPSSS